MLDTCWFHYCFQGGIIAQDRSSMMGSRGVITAPEHSRDGHEPAAPCQEELVVPGEVSVLQN